MVPTGGKILNFGLCESLKFELSRTFYSPKLSLKSVMLHCLEALTLKIGVLTDFANFTGKQLCWNLFLIKMQASTLQLY